MMRSSAKNHWRLEALIMAAAFAGGGAGAVAAGPAADVARPVAAPQMNPPADPPFRREFHYKFRIDARYGLHTQAPRDVATHRYTLTGEQSFRFSRSWSLMASGRAYAEAAYAANPARYSREVRELDSTELLARDLYLEYKGGPLLLRLGNQQVAWGEAFGFFYADVVNPKDMREGGLGELSEQRLPVPMANLKFIFSRSSLQFLYIPRPYFNKLPAQGSDFAPDFRSTFPGVEVTVKNDQALPLRDGKGEYGTRLTTLAGGYDLSLFYLHQFDRSPNYSTTVTSLSPTTFTPLTLTLANVHYQIDRFGLTMTKDLGAHLLRFESVYTPERHFDGLLPDGSYGSRVSAELVYVAGLDFTQLNPWNLSLQWSQDYMLAPFRGSFRQGRQDLLSLYVARTFWRDHEAELTLTYMPSDGGSRAQFEYVIPRSSILEFRLGADILAGKHGSQFGAFGSASRAYVGIRGYFSD